MKCSTKTTDKCGTVICRQTQLPESVSFRNHKENYNTDPASIDEISCGQPWHESAQLEADAKPLAFCRTVQRRRFGFGSAHSESCLPLVSRHYHFPMSRGNRGKSASALTVTMPILLMKGESDVHPLCHLTTES
jgi:hypothetical protein